MKEKMDKVCAQTKGITLIALVVTIIVLLILAGITINMLIGKNGIITRTQQSKEEYNSAQIVEEVHVAWGKAEIDHKTGEVEDIAVALQTELRKKDSGATAVWDTQNTIKAHYKEHDVYINTETGETNSYPPISARFVTAKTDGGMAAAIDDEGKVYTWGQNFYGQLGNGNEEDTTTPICISDIQGNVLKDKKITSVKSNYMAIAIDTEGKVYTWGRNHSGQLGNGSDQNSNVPTCISDIGSSALKNKKIVFAEIGGTTAIAIDENGKVYTWGNNESGQLGNGSNQYSSVPICISDIDGNILKGKRIVSAQVSRGTIVAIDENGKVYTWGANDSGQLGNGSNQYSSVPICVSDIDGNILKGQKIISTKIEEYHSTITAIDENGKVYVWGGNSGELTNGNYENRNIPICVSDIEGSVLKNKKIISIDIDEIIIAVDEEGKVYTWGRADKTGHNENPDIPVCISDIEGSALKGRKITNISLGQFGTTAIDSEGKVYTWGINYGQLGIENDKDGSVPRCISDIEENALKDKKMVKSVQERLYMILLDENGKMYTFGELGYPM